jgi:hypothetical protein
VITLVNNGTATNAGVAVRGNNSLSLNGTTQYLSGTIEGIANNSWSISGWFFFKGSGLYFSIGTNAAMNEIMTLFINPANSRYYIAFNGNDTNSTSFSQDLNNWVHLVFMYDINTRERSIYRKGIKLTLTNSFSVPINCSNNFKIGSYSRYPATFYNGCIDDFRIYTGRVLSQAQITELYAGNPYYNLPTALTRYNTDPINTTYQFEIKDEEQKFISHY